MIQDRIKMGKHFLVWVKDNEAQKQMHIQDILKKNPEFAVRDNEDKLFLVTDMSKVRERARTWKGCNARGVWFSILDQNDVEKKWDTDIHSEVLIAEAVEELEM